MDNQAVAEYGMRAFSMPIGVRIAELHQGIAAQLINAIAYGDSCVCGKLELVGHHPGRFFQAPPLAARTFPPFMDAACFNRHRFCKNLPKADMGSLPNGNDNVLLVPLRAVYLTQKLSE